MKVIFLAAGTKELAGGEKKQLLPSLVLSELLPSSANNHNSFFKGNTQ